MRQVRSFAARFCGAITTLLLTVWALPGFAQGLPRHVPGELLIKFRPAANASERADLRRQMSAEVVRELRMTGAEHVRLRGVGVEQTIARFRNHPLVEYVEPNYEVQALVVPNDPMFSQMYALHNTGQTGGTPGADIRAMQAWDLFTGDPDLRVGVVDTGVDFTHPDLAANVWTNPGEIPGNGLDDEGNGYIDDVHGYDFFNNDGDPFDDNGHGTHVSGTIAAVGDNGVGVVGVNWQAKVVALKFLGAGGSGPISAAIGALQYMHANGIKLSNHSWGGPFSQAFLDALTIAGGAGHLAVCAAGNAGSNIDISPTYPAAYDTPYRLTVAASDHSDQLAGFSNYGAVHVDLAAPGVNILSTLPGVSYGEYSGTSMAAPHVAGAMALIMGRWPALSALEAKQQLLLAVDPVPAFAGITATGGRLNAYTAVFEPDETPPGAISDLAPGELGSNTVRLTWTATGDDGASGRARHYDLRYSLSPITEASFAVANQAPAPNPQASGAPETAEVGGLAFNTTYYFALRALDELQNPGPISNVASATTLGIPDVSASPLAFSHQLFTGTSATQTLTLRNDGAGTLDFTIPNPQLAEASSIPSMALDKGQEDPRTGDPVLTGAGGPDAFGYRWIDSDEPGGPAFGWVDIVGSGQSVPIAGDDAISQPIALGMSFPFYGSSFSAIYVCTNGFVSFTNTPPYYSNQPLPSDQAPANLVAPFWDDLFVPSPTQIWVKSEGSRFIVSWIGVYHLGGAGPYTFQLILEANGGITFQYLGMTPPVNGSTTGIQNATGTVGLLTAFNTDYVHNQLATRFARVPTWLTAAPRSGRIQAGQSTDIQLGYNAYQMQGGTYHADLRVLSNDPDESLLTLPVDLTVIGAPDIRVSPVALDYGQLFIGFPQARSFSVVNAGTDLLHVNGMTTGEPTVTVSPAAFNLAPYDTQVVVATWSPLEPGALSASLSISSDDPDTPNFAVALTGSAVHPPQVQVTPASLEATVDIPAAASRLLTVRNTGASPLNWSLTVGGALASSPGGTPPPFDRPSQWAADPRRQAPPATALPVPPAQTLALPVVVTDPAGDADQPDIRLLRADGSLDLLRVELEMTAPVNLFDFGGYLSLDTDRNPATGTPPSAGAPGQDIGTEFEVLLFSLPYGLVDVYRTTGEYMGSFPVQVLGNVVRFTLPLSALGNDDGNIDVTGVIGTAFGPTDWFPDAGHGTISSASWLTGMPGGGTLAPGESAEIQVSMQSAGLVGGTYHGSLHVESNDPDDGRVSVPVTLVAIGVPDIAFDPSFLDFGVLLVGNTRDLSLRVHNVGSDSLRIDSATLSHPSFTFLSAEFPVVIAPGDSVDRILRFAPSQVCQPCTGTLAFVSNDPDENPAILDLSGTGNPPPDVGVSPTELSITLPIPGTGTREITISNTGQSDLFWSIDWRASFAGGTAAATSWQILGPAPGSGNLAVAGMGAQAVRATYGASLSEPRILVYSDEYQAPPGDHYSDRALQRLGLPYTAYYNSPFGFGNALVGESWDLVIVEHANFYELGSWWSEIETYLNAGGRVMISTFDVDGSHSEPTTLWSTIGLAPAGDLLTPRPVHWWEPGHRLFHQPETVPPLQSPADIYLDDGDLVGVHPAAENPAGFVPARTLDQAAIVLSADERAIVGSFAISEYTVDADGDSVPDGVELMANAISLLFRGADWLSADPSEGTLPVGTSVNVTIGFDTEGLLGGVYPAVLEVLSNDPDEPVIEVPVTLTAVGIPDIAAEPSSLDFGSLFVGLTRDLNLALVNVGSDRLDVTSLSFTDASFSFPDSAPPSSFSIAPRDTMPVRVRFSPSAPCSPCAGALRITSNDPDEDPFEIPLAGNGVLPPQVEVDPGTLVANVPIPETQSRALTISNPGGSPLEFSFPVYSDAVPQEVDPGLELERDAQDPRAGVLGRGGPDGFGYRWRDSDEPGGPPFQWVGAHQTRIPFQFLDQNITGIPVGFSFPFYGSEFNSINVCTHGWFSFTNSNVQWTNQPLPSFGAPENLVAPFWDDLNVPAGGQVWYEATPSRFAITWYNVPRTGGGPPVTFEAVLYPSGRIVFNYLSITPPTNSSTIGIQNATRSIGLTTVFNAPYVHNGLAVEISRRSEWLNLTPASGVVPPGGSLEVQADFTTAGLGYGFYQEALQMQTNVPGQELVNIPTYLNAGVVPDLGHPAAVDFGTVYVGYPEDFQVPLQNIGAGVLQLESSQVSGTGYSRTSSPTEILLPGESTTVGLRFDPPAPCSPCAGSLSVVSNDPNELDATMELGALGLLAPVIGVPPDSVRAAAATTLGAEARHRTRSLVVTNTGGSDLEFAAQAAPYPPGPPVAYQGTALAKGQADPNPGILGTGGPDQYGYQWRDSDEAAGPVFDWVDITGVGTLLPIYGDDFTRLAIPIGFAFPFYGNSFSTVNVCTNGFLSFTSISTQYWNVPLPLDQAPENLLAAFWSDLYVSSPRIWVHNDGSRFIVSWVDVRHLSVNNSLTFQIILYPDGRFRFQYLSMSSPNDNATIGIQNGTRNDGLTVAYNAPYVHGGLATEFAVAPRWLSVSPGSGVIPPGGSATLQVEFDATNLPDTDHAGRIQLLSNDPATPVLEVPCVLHVGVVGAALDVDPNSINRDSHGNWVTSGLDLPPELDVHAVATGTIRVQRALALAAGAPMSYEDTDGDGTDEMEVKFDRVALQALLPDGDAVPVEVIGEVDGVTWFQAFDLVRLFRPGGPDPGAGLLYEAGSSVVLEWIPPAGATAETYDLWFSSDGGDSWTLVEGGMTGTSCVWSVPAQVTDTGQLEIVASDDQGHMGSWLSQQFRIVTGSVAVEDGGPAPLSFALRLAGPSPARGDVRLRLAVPESATMVSVGVFDVRGARVRVLADATMGVGWHDLRWDGADARGHKVSAGVYYVHLRAGSAESTTRVVLLR